MPVKSHRNDARGICPFDAARPVPPGASQVDETRQRPMGFAIHSMNF
jgi:hypothetical protein